MGEETAFFAAREAHVLAGDKLGGQWRLSFSGSDVNKRPLELGGPNLNPNGM